MHLKTGPFLRGRGRRGQRQFSRALVISQTLRVHVPKYVVSHLFYFIHFVFLFLDFFIS